MAVTGASPSEYKEYLSQGGLLTFQIDELDIDPSGSFKLSPLIAPHLKTGFELRPTSMIDDDLSAMPLLLHGDNWTKIVVFTYRRGGSIIYRQLNDGRYEAKTFAPPQTEEDAADQKQK